MKEFTGSQIYHALSQIQQNTDKKAPAIFVDSDEAYRHLDADFTNKIKFIGNNYAFKNARYVNAYNYWPRYAYNRTLASGSVNVTCIDGFCIFDGDSTGDGGNWGNAVTLAKPIPAGTYKLLVEIFAVGTTIVTAKNNVFSFAYKNGGNKQITISLGTADIILNDITFTDEVVTFNRTYEVRASSDYHNYICWFGLYPVDAEIIDTGLSVEQDEEIEYELSLPATDVDTMQHKSIISHVVDTKEYVDNLDVDVIAELPFLCPEQFGAVGDGVADDTAAVQACVNEASRYTDNRNKPVIGCGRYKITSSIRIGGFNLDICLKTITYTGNDAALIISGKNSHFQFDEITATTGSNAVGLRLLCTLDSNVNFAGFESNVVDVIQRIYANGNGLEMIRDDESTEGFYYNTINVHKISSVNANCIYGDGKTNFAEIDIYGQAMSAPNGYLYYANRLGATGVRLHNMCIEQNVKNGIYGGASLFHCRTSECMNHYTPQEQDRGRIFVLYGNACNATIAADRYTSVALLAVDVSNVLSYEEMVEVVKDYYDETGDRNAWPKVYGYGMIRPKVLELCRFVSESGFAGSTVWRRSGKIIIYYNHIGFIPNNDVEKQITDTPYVIKLEQTPESARQYLTPTIFDIQVAESEIYLDWSYCCCGIKEFRVRQYTNKKATVYDKFGNLLFDGTNLPEGTYVFRCIETTPERITYRDGTQATWTEWANPYGTYTGSNEKWVVTKEDIIELPNV